LPVAGLFLHAKGFLSDVGIEAESSITLTAMVVRNNLTLEEIDAE